KRLAGQQSFPLTHPSPLRGEGWVRGSCERRHFPLRSLSEYGIDVDELILRESRVSARMWAGLAHNGNRTRAGSSAHRAAAVGRGYPSLDSLVSAVILPHENTRRMSSAAETRRGD